MPRRKNKEMPQIQVQQTGPKSSNAPVLFVIAAIAIIAIVALMIFALSQKKEDIGLGVPKIIKNETISCDSDDCMLQLAKSQKDAALCDRIKNGTIMQNCLKQFASSSLDACLKLEDYQSKKDCVELHAVKNDQLILCNELREGDVRECTETIRPCYYKSPEEKPLCLAVTSRNYSSCGGEESCIFSYAMQLRDPAACADIQGIPERYACISLARDYDTCLNLTYEPQRDYCYEIYAKKSGKEHICGDISGSTVYELNCYSYFSAKENNKDLCKEVELLNRWKCYQNYSWETEDPSGCETIDEFATNSKIECFVTFSKIYGNPSVCEGITLHPGSKESCYQVGITNNPALTAQKCENVTLENWMRSCYTAAANLAKDIKICDELKTEEEKQFCRINYKE